MLFLRPHPQGHLRFQDGGWANWALGGRLHGVGQFSRQDRPLGPFTQKEDDRSARITLGLGSAERGMFSAISLHVRVVFGLRARIILSERKDDPGARMILPPCKWPQEAQFAHHPETGDDTADEFLGTTWPNLCTSRRFQTRR